MSMRMPLVAGVLFRPGDCFRRISRSPSWVTAFIVLGVGKVIADWLRNGIQLRAIALSAGSVSADQMHSLMSFLAAAKVVSLALTPLGLLARWMITAAIIYWLLVLVSEEAKFKPVLSVTAHCWTAMLLGRFCNVLILYLKGPQEMASSADMNALLGLDLFAPGVGNPLLLAVLKNVTVFTVWYFSLMTMGISQVFGISKRRAAFPVVFVFGLVVLWKAGLSALSSGLGQ